MLLVVRPILIMLMKLMKPLTLPDLMRNPTWMVIELRKKSTTTEFVKRTRLKNGWMRWSRISVTWVMNPVKGRILAEEYQEGPKVNVILWSRAIQIFPV